MAKKIFLFLLILITVNNLQINALGNDNYTNEYKQMFEDMLPFYKNLYECTPYTINKNGMTYKILGKHNDKCEVRMGYNYNEQTKGMGFYCCFFPTDVAKQYSITGTKYTRKKINDINRTQKIYVSNDEETEYMNTLQRKYCGACFRQ